MKISDVCSKWDNYFHEDQVLYQPCYLQAQLYVVGSLKECMALVELINSFCADCHERLASVLSGYRRTCPVRDRVWDFIRLRGWVRRGGRNRPAAMPSLSADAHSATLHPVWIRFSWWIHNVDCERMVELRNVSGTPALNMTFAMMFYK